ncbi:MAG: TonB C-terminal domain-containing protein [Candidatus Aminicenantes bacterium]|nr:MAG: TonB C-terminal domain-containing protein [Candidatus Aminicenantes bacterium]
MKFKAAVIISVALHISIFAIALYVPMKSSHKGTVYYVDLIHMPGGGGGGDKTQKGGGQLVQEPQRMKDLTTQKEETQSKLRYPDQDKKSKKKSRKKKKKPEKKQLITMTRKDREKTQAPVTVSRKGTTSSDILKTGISAGGGGGSGGGYGTGTGTGYGPGSGSGTAFFPYAYYIETLRSKVSSSWYSGLVSPGQRGQFFVVVYFKILRSGQITDLNVSQKSGISSLDLSARRAVENAAPFPPLPNDYPYSYLPVSFEFVWGKK